MAMFDDAKAGDPVWNPRHGWGKVEAVVIDPSSSSLRVKFEDGSIGVFYTDGKVLGDDVSPTLFWKEQKLDLEKPDPKYKWVLGRTEGKNRIVIVIPSDGVITRSEAERYLSIFNGHSWDWIEPIDATKED